MGEAYTEGVAAAVIKEALARPGWSQARLARALHVRPQTVNKWVTGENTPPVPRWRVIEEALGIERGTIMRRSGYVDDPGQVSEGTAALSGIDTADLTPDEVAQVQGYIDALRERRRTQK